MNLLTIVSKSDGPLKAAGVVADNLQRSRMIQNWGLSGEIWGIELTLQPPIADLVKDRGGWDAYRAAVVGAFGDDYEEAHEKAPEAPEPEGSAGTGAADHEAPTHLPEV